MKIIAVEYKRKHGDNDFTVMAEVSEGSTPEDTFFNLRKWTEDKISIIDKEDGEQSKIDEEKTKVIEELSSKRDEIQQILDRLDGENKILDSQDVSDLPVEEVVEGTEQKEENQSEGVAETNTDGIVPTEPNSPSDDGGGKIGE